MIDWLMSLLFPEKCINCGVWGKYVCQKCQVGMWEAEPLRALDGMTCLWAYEGIVQKIIKRAKYKGQYDLLQFTIRKSQIPNKSQLPNIQMIVPIPLHKGRLMERGFNQAEIIAKEISKIYKIPVVNLLTRTKDTGHQVGRTRAERLTALKGAFSITPRPPLNLRGGVNILLVDDVWTTGTTMRECYKVLKKAGVKKVYGLVLAR